MAETTNVERNFLSPQGFRFSLKRAPGVDYHLQKTNIPDISLEMPRVPNPFISYVVAPSTMKFSPLNVEFKVDENMQNFLEIFNWMIGLGGPDNYWEYKNLTKPSAASMDAGLFSDITMLVTTAVKEVNLEVTYVDAIPFFLGGFTLNTTDAGIEYVTSKASFYYTRYYIKPYVT